MKDWIREFVEQVLAWFAFLSEMRHLIEMRLDEIEARVVDIQATLFFKNRQPTVLN